MLRIVCASYSQDLATKRARDFRTVLESEWYKRLFALTRIDAQKNTKAEIQLTAQGYRLSTSVGGPLTGRGGNVILIDDPMKPAQMASEAPVALDAWLDIAPSSAFLNKICRRPLPPAVDFHLLFGYRRDAHTLGMSGDGVLTLSSMLSTRVQREATSVWGIDQDRTGILRSENTAQRVNAILAASEAGRP